MADGCYGGGQCSGHACSDTTAWCNRCSALVCPRRFGGHLACRLDLLLAIQPCRKPCIFTESTRSGMKVLFLGYGIEPPIPGGAGAIQSEMVRSLTEIGVEVTIFQAGHYD